MKIIEIILNLLWIIKYCSVSTSLIRTIKLFTLKLIKSVVKSCCKEKDISLQKKNEVVIDT